MKYAEHIHAPKGMKPADSSTGRNCLKFLCQFWISICRFKCGFQQLKLARGHTLGYYQLFSSLTYHWRRDFIWYTALDAGFSDVFFLLRWLNQVPFVFINNIKSQGVWEILYVVLNKEKPFVLAWMCNEPTQCTKAYSLVIGCSYAQYLPLGIVGFIR